jgi:Zn-dependent protease
VTPGRGEIEWTFDRLQVLRSGGRIDTRGRADPRFGGSGDDRKIDSPNATAENVRGMTYPFEQPRRTAVRPSPVFLLVVAIAVASGWYAWHVGNPAAVSKADGFAVLVFVVSLWVVTLCLHEFAHAFSAWRFGDHEVESRGYLSLNPLKYAHPVLSIALPILFIAIGGIGLPGGAVYLHPERFRSKAQRAVVSLVGPAMNAVAAVILLVLCANFGPGASSRGNEHAVFWLAVSFLALLQVMAAFLNLLPIPGLDGWGVIEPYLDPAVQRGAQQFKPWGMIAIFAFLQIDSVNREFFNAVYRVFDFLGGNQNFAYFGYQLFKFWNL